MLPGADSEPSAEETGRPYGMNLVNDNPEEILTWARRFVSDLGCTEAGIAPTDPELAIELLSAGLRSGLDSTKSAWEQSDLTPEAMRSSALININVFLRGLERWRLPAETKAYIQKTAPEFVQELLDLGVSVHQETLVATGEESDLKHVLAFAARIDLQKTISVCNRYSSIHPKDIKSGLVIACQLQPNVLTDLETISTKYHDTICAEFIRSPQLLTVDLALHCLKWAQEKQKKLGQHASALNSFLGNGTTNWSKDRSFDLVHNYQVLEEIFSNLGTVKEKEMFKICVEDIFRCYIDSIPDSPYRRLSPQIQKVIEHYQSAKQTLKLPIFGKFEEIVNEKPWREDPKHADMLSLFQQQLIDYQIPNELKPLLEEDFYSLTAHDARAVVFGLKKRTERSITSMPYLWQGIARQWNAQGFMHNMPLGNEVPVGTSTERALARTLLLTTGTYDDGTIAIADELDDYKKNVREVESLGSPSRAETNKEHIKQQRALSDKKLARSAYLYAVSSLLSDTSFSTDESMQDLLCPYLAQEDSVFSNAMVLISDTKRRSKLLQIHAHTLRKFGCSDEKLVRWLYSCIKVPDFSQEGITIQTGIDSKKLAAIINASWAAHALYPADPSIPTLANLLAPKFSERVQVRVPKKKKFPSLDLQMEVGRNLNHALRERTNQEALLPFYAEIQKTRKKIAQIVPVAMQSVQAVLTGMTRVAERMQDRKTSLKIVAGLLATALAVRHALELPSTAENTQTDGSGLVVKADTAKNKHSEHTVHARAADAPTDSDSPLASENARVKPPSLGDPLSDEFAADARENGSEIRYQFSDPLEGDQRYLHTNIIIGEDPNTFQARSTKELYEHPMASYVNALFEAEIDRTKRLPIQEVTRNALTMPAFDSGIILPLPYGARVDEKHMRGGADDYQIPTNRGLRHSGVSYFFVDPYVSMQTPFKGNPIFDFTVPKNTSQPLHTRVNGTPFTINDLYAAVLNNFRLKVSRATTTEFNEQFAPKLDRTILKKLAPALDDVLVAIEFKKEDLPAAEVVEILREAVSRFIRYTPTHAYQSLLDGQPYESGRHAYLERILTLQEGECQQYDRLLRELLAQVGIPSIATSCFLADGKEASLQDGHQTTLVPMVAAEDGRIFLKIYDSTSPDLREDLIEQEKVAALDQVIQKIQSSNGVFSQEQIQEAQQLMEQIQHSFQEKKDEGELMAKKEQAHNAGITSPVNAAGDTLDRSVLEAIQKPAEPTDNTVEKLEELQCMLFGIEHDAAQKQKERIADDAQVSDPTLLSVEPGTVVPDYASLLSAVLLALSAATAWRTFARAQTEKTSQKNRPVNPAVLPRKRPRSLLKKAKDIAARTLPILPYIQHYDDWQAELETANMERSQSSVLLNSVTLDTFFTLPGEGAAQKKTRLDARLDALLKAEEKKQKQISNLAPYAAKFMERYFVSLVKEDSNGYSVSYTATANTMLATWIRRVLVEKEYIQKWLDQKTEDDLQKDLKVRLLEYLLEEMTKSIMMNDGFSERPDTQSPLKILEHSKRLPEFENALDQLSARRKFKLCNKKQPAENYPALLRVLH